MHQALFLGRIPNPAVERGGDREADRAAWAVGELKDPGRSVQAQTQLIGHGEHYEP